MVTRANGGSGETLREMNRRHAQEFRRERAKTAPTIQCSECSNHEQAGKFTEQELIDDGEAER